MTLVVHANAVVVFVTGTMTSTYWVTGMVFVSKMVTQLVVVTYCVTGISTWCPPPAFAAPNSSPRGTKTLIIDAIGSILEQT